jgi:CarD family transcriptional regulator, regulator of rRNA transcription
VQFKVGDKVVYPSQGVSVVEEISNEVLGGTEVTCYHLRLFGSDSKVMVPVDNSERVGLRPLSEKKVVKSVMKRLKGSEGESAEDWKDRYRANLDRIKTGELDEIVNVLLCLAEVAGRKTLSFRERKMYDHARQLLVHEVAEVEGREVDKVERQVENALGSVVKPDEE